MSAVMTEQLSTGALESHLPNPAGAMISPNERDLVTALVQQARTDRSAFESLYRLHVDAVYRYCLRRVGSPETAADLTSQIFIKVYTNLQSCDERRFRSWLFTIARNTLIDDRRNHREHTSLDDALGLVSGEPSPETILLEKEERTSVVALLSALTADQRQVVELRLAGLNGAEIAEVLGRSRASVDTAQSRAITRLRHVMLSNRDKVSEDNDVSGQ